jgi:hypothetical protein
VNFPFGCSNLSVSPTYGAYISQLRYDIPELIFSIRIFLRKDNDIPELASYQDFFRKDNDIPELASLSAVI